MSEENNDDGLLPELSETEKNELMTMIQEHQKLGEQNPSYYP